MGGDTVKQVFRFVALGALFLIPLTPLLVPTSFFFPFITGKAFYFRTLVEIVFAAWIGLALIDKNYRPRFSWIGAGVLAFVVWMFIADLFAINVLKAFWSNFERMEGWMLLAHLAALFFAGGAVLRVEHKWRLWFFISLGVSVIVVCYALLQLAGSIAIHQGSSRIDASFGNSAYLGIYLLFNVFLAGWLALTEREAWIKWSLIALAVIEGFLVFMTETRGTVLGLLAGLLLAGLLTALTAGKRARTIAAVGMAVIVVVAGGLWLARDSAFVQSNHTLQRVTSISLDDLSVRFMIWNIAWKGFLDRPITGYGQEGFNYAFNAHYDPALYAQEQWFDRAHNAFIDWLIAGGLPALILYLFLFGSVITLLWARSELSRPERIALTAAFAGYAVHNLVVFDNLYAYVYFFAILALVDSQVSRPIAYFEKAKTVGNETATTAVLPLTIVAAVLLIGFINYPGIRASSGLIAAITPRSNPAENLAAFQEVLAHPAFAAQEIREQLVSFALDVTQNPNMPEELRTQAASLAISEMEAQNTEHPGDARSQLQLSLAYRAAGDTKSALAAIDAAHALSPNKEQIYIQRGVTAWDLGDTKAVQEAFHAAYALGPQFTDLAAYSAAGDIVAGDIAAAHKTLMDAFGTTVVDSDALAVAYYRMKDYPDLIALWKLRVEKSQSIQAYFGLAAAYHVGGNTGAAIATLNAVVAKYPEAKEQANQLLSQINSGAK